jgi:hypothetical protein
MLTTGGLFLLAFVVVSHLVARRAFRGSSLNAFGLVVAPLLAGGYIVGILLVVDGLRMAI